MDPGTGFYFYKNVHDCRTFNIYKKYGISAMNIHKCDVTNEQWKHMYDIGYKNPDE